MTSQGLCNLINVLCVIGGYPSGDGGGGGGGVRLVAVKSRSFKDHELHPSLIYKSHSGRIPGIAGQAGANLSLSASQREGRQSPLKPAMLYGQSPKCSLRCGGLHSDGLEGPYPLLTKHS